MASVRQGNMAWLARALLIVAAVALVLAIALRRPSARPAASPPPPARAPDAPVTVSELERRQHANPRDPDGWRALGAAYFDRSRFADAARAYVHAAELEPASAPDWSALGEALVYARRSGIDADAAHAFTRALALDPKDARARYFLGVRKDMAGDHRGAVDDWIALLGDAPPGAPWEQSVRALVTQVAARYKIALAGRLPPERAAPPAAASDAIPGPSREQMAEAARLSPTEQNAMAREMVARLAARLAADPRDADGWIRLMRARLVLGDRPGAEQAHDAARAALPDSGARARIDAAAAALGVR